jgi:hypothetical protein
VPTRDWNAVRFDPGGSPDHVESYFIKLNEPTGTRALWLKATILSGKGRSAVAEAWAIGFDREAGHVGVKRVVPFAEARFSKTGLDVQVADMEIHAGRTRGTIVKGTDRIEWDLEFDASGEPLVPYPSLKMYEGPLPSQKMVTPFPDTRFSGRYRVNDRETRVEGWKGMQGHNWGKRHTELYAWGHVNQWDNAENLVLEGATGRVKVGPVLVPPLTVLAVWHEGVRYAFNTGRGIIGNRGVITQRAWRFEAENAEARLHGELAADADEMVGLYYENPNGEMTYCLNSKIAWALITLETKRGQKLRARSACAALEIGTKDPKHGIRMLA